MNRRHGWLVPLLWMSTALAMAAQPPSVSTRVDRDQITVGDRFTFTVEVEREKDVTLLTPLSSIAGQLAHFQVKEYRPLANLPAPADSVAEGIEFELSTYVSGDYPIPPVALAYQMPTGATGVVHTDVTMIHVKSVLPVDDTGLVPRDVRPPVIAPGTGAVTRVFLFVLLGIGVVGLLVGGLLLWLSRRSRPVTPPEPPHVAAQRRLAQLRASDGFRMGDARFFATELSDLARRYLGDRWQYNAIDLTTTEIAGTLALHGIPQDWHTRLVETLQACDRVKFADLPMPQEEMDDRLGLIERFVTETIPAEQPQTAAAATAEMVHG